MAKLIEGCACGCKTPADTTDGESLGPLKFPETPFVKYSATCWSHFYMEQSAGAVARIEEIRRAYGRLLQWRQAATLASQGTCDCGCGRIANLHGKTALSPFFDLLRDISFNSSCWSEFCDSEHYDNCVRKYAIKCAPQCVVRLNLTYCACGCGAMADLGSYDNPKETKADWLWIAPGSINQACWKTKYFIPGRTEAEAAALLFKQIRSVRSSVHAMTEFWESLSSREAPTTAPAQSETPALAAHCACSPLAVVTMGDSCSYCHLRIHGVELNQRQNMDLDEKSVAARLRMEAADQRQRRIDIQLNRPTPSSRELAKGHPASWPSNEGEE